ncbi:hypothetical protein GC163_00590 [bacterium]|nr:hypothetical protein [bacterium]
MTDGWLDDVARFADVMEAAQQHLLETQRLKRQALVSGSLVDLEPLNEAALQAARRLKALTIWRSRLLDQAHAEGYADLTLSDVLSHSTSPLPEQLRGRFALIQQRFGEAKREAWIQWIVAQRMSGCYTDLLDLMARGGQRPLGYDESPNPQQGVGGAVLDAAV